MGRRERKRRSQVHKIEMTLDAERIWRRKVVDVERLSVAGEGRMKENRRQVGGRRDGTDRLKPIKHRSTSQVNSRLGAQLEQSSRPRDYEDPMRTYLVYNWKGSCDFVDGVCLRKNPWMVSRRTIEIYNRE
jgi:hypothetical protein